MVLFIVLGAVILITFCVMGFLLVTMDKEGGKGKEEKTVAWDELSSHIPKTADGSEIIPAFVPQKEDQSVETRQMIERLTKENESLKSQKAFFLQAQEKLIELQADTDRLRAQNADLQTQLDSGLTKSRLLEEEIAQARAAVSQLNLEKESWNLSLKKAEDPLEKTDEKLPEPDTQLAEKVESLQYELVKARAQSTGLERIGSNYKSQMEDLLKKINEAQSANDQLSQAKNRLEGILQELKSQNDELVKKDQLAQFELEKNRSQLLNLEREYEDFKARTQQKT